MIEQPTLLAIDTSGVYAAIAVIDAAGVLAQHVWLTRQSHTVSLLPAIHQLLDRVDAKIDGVSAFGVAIGPGAFTGLRIGISTARALAWSLNVPCVAIGTLDALAFGRAGCPGDLCAVIDAGRGDWYAGWYRIGAVEFRCLRGPELLESATIGNLIEPGTLVCTDSAASAERFAAACPTVALPVNASAMTPSPASLALLAWRQWQRGDAPNLEDVQPVYIRRPAAEERRAKT